MPLAAPTLRSLLDGNVRSGVRHPQPEEVVAKRLDSP
jgi:hypothetical protein